jgi:hypothetical protein
MQSARIPRSVARYQQNTEAGWLNANPVHEDQRCCIWAASYSAADQERSEAALRDPLTSELEKAKNREVKRGKQWLSR